MGWANVTTEHAEIVSDNRRTGRSAAGAHVRAPWPSSASPTSTSARTPTPVPASLAAAGFQPLVVARPAIRRRPRSASLLRASLYDRLAELRADRRTLSLPSAAASSATWPASSLRPESRPAVVHGADDAAGDGG